MRSLWARFIRKAAFKLQEVFHINSKYSLGYTPDRLLRQCISLRADLYICHQELATVVGNQLLQLGYRVAFDLEDWYSEDLLPRDRESRPIKLLKKAERGALENGICYTTSEAMAKGIQASYHAVVRPAVIYNSFSAAQLRQPVAPSGTLPRLYWFSQTIGPGRGLEFFIKAMSKSRFSWQLNLRGNISPAYQRLLANNVTMKDRLIFLPMLSNHELMDDLGNYDLGLALEPTSPPNKNLTISNKIFHYMSAGLPVIASNTAGQMEIARKNPKFTFVYDQDNQEGLVTILDNLGKKLKDNKLMAPRNEIIETYRLHFEWETEAKKLTDIIGHALR
ncbi:glycosyltransferase [Mucilaginibacter sabulilitoris]|uniref:Glycosyltransferase n=1 Tax=Mucilaginibacter sabulilitoris TaxID=1173583 RepID=A0ABZ0TGF3_9SPHI|nr:glycosyltransferase [Mucilaginibacter sabulilitoris]WPU91656.1 glycosyltransferase [Mucilaginibacter sabulilitoris]